MNDFTELEKELKRLRPLSPSAGLAAGVEQALNAPAAASPNEETVVVRPARFEINWLPVGLGLAAAAAFLFLARVETPETSSPQAPMLTQRSVPQEAATSGFQPTGMTEVVYHQRDEGLRYPQGADQPVRRTRLQKQETVQWHNAETGASLRVSYPAEEVRLIPVSGQ